MSRETQPAAGWCEGCGEQCGQVTHTHPDTGATTDEGSDCCGCEVLADDPTVCVDCGSLVRRWGEKRCRSCEEDLRDFNRGVP